MRRRPSTKQQPAARATPTNEPITIPAIAPADNSLPDGSSTAVVENSKSFHCSRGSLTTHALAVPEDMSGPREVLCCRRDCGRMSLVGNSSLPSSTRKAWVGREPGAEEYWKVKEVVRLDGMSAVTVTLVIASRTEQPSVMLTPSNCGRTGEGKGTQGGGCILDLMARLDQSKGLKHGLRIRVRVYWVL